MTIQPAGPTQMPPKVSARAGRHSTNIVAKYISEWVFTNTDAAFATSPWTVTGAENLVWV